MSHSGGESWGALPPNLKRRQNNQTLINTKYLHKWCNSVVTNWTLEDLRLWLVALLRSISLNNKEFTYICKYFTEFTKNQNKSPKAHPVRNNSCFKHFASATYSWRSCNFVSWFNVAWVTNLDVVYVTILS